MKNRALAGIFLFALMGLVFNVWRIEEPFHTIMMACIWTCVAVCAFFGLKENQSMVDSQTKAILVKAKGMLQQAADFSHILYVDEKDPDRKRTLELDSQGYGLAVNHIDRFLIDHQGNKST